jgi:methionyl-tRNA formyltransferase
VEQLRAWAPDLIVVAAFGQILRAEVLELPAHGCLNVHASLLPRWRGAAPIHAAILAGDAHTGVTIMKMDAGLDTGPILSQRRMPLTADDTTGSASARLAELGADLLLETIPGYLSGAIAPVPQPVEGVTLAPMLHKEQGRLDFTQPADELQRRVRAYQPWPGAFMELDGARLKLLRTHVAPGDAAAGERLVCRDETDELPAVGAGGGLLVLDEVQPAGRKPMTGRAFLAGVRNWRSQVL